MTYDAAAVEQLISEVTQTFALGLRSIANAAAKEAELERQRLADERRLLEKERKRLEEAWSHISSECARRESSVGACTGLSAVSVSATSPKRRPPSSVQSVPSELSGSTRGDQLQMSVPVLSCATIGSPMNSSVSPVSCGPHIDYVPSDCTLTLQGYSYSVLPLQFPDASNLGHDLWNKTVELPQGWEVLSEADPEFHQALPQLTQRGWGAIVLGIKNAHNGFNAFWTPLFSDGSHAGLLCEEDVDWIDPVENRDNQYRMTYSGLRMVIRQRVGPVVVQGRRLGMH